MQKKSIRFKKMAVIEVTGLSLSCLECGAKADFICRGGDRCHCEICVSRNGCFLKRPIDFLQRKCFFDFFSEFVISIKTNEFQTNGIFQDLDLVEELKQLLVVEKQEFTSFYGILADEIFKRVKKYISYLYFRNYKEYLTIGYVNVSFNKEHVYLWGKGLCQVGRVKNLNHLGWPSGILRNYILEDE